MQVRFFVAFEVAVSYNGGKGGLKMNKENKRLDAVRTLKPQPERLADDEHYARRVMVEYRQCMEEGLDVEMYRPLFETVSRMPDGDIRERFADVIGDLVLNLPRREDYPFVEPSDLAGIREQRDLSLWQDAPVDETSLRDRFTGAWLGRICGCLLGKPIEGMRTDELHQLLKGSDNFPMHRYITSRDYTEEQQAGWRFKVRPVALADLIDAAPSDDDTNYMVLYQRLIEKCGRDFTPYDVMKLWLRNQRKDAYFTAERAAFCNFVKGYLPPDSAIHQNPYREWIGAQIRADYFGYINPGKPEAAAEMAWRDASVSHVKNGIYGEMWAAAMIACAAVCDDMEKVILGGLAQIPARSRLFKDVMSVINEWRSGITAADVFARIHTEWNEFEVHDWCHTNSNAMIVTACLLYGGGDYSKSICMAVETGFDTDCNGATVGSVIGMMRGSAAVGEEWTKPLNGKLRTEIFGMTCLEINELIEKTLTHL